MSVPSTYPSTTPNFGLPLLFPGQAQKEFFVNAALSLCDRLLHPAIEGETGTAPADPGEGQGWLVADGASGEFAGRAGELAFRIGNAWEFTVPRDGMRLYDRGAHQYLVFNGAWIRPSPVVPPSGGQTVDVEARVAIGALIAALARGGIIPEN